jgi:YARHG domain
MPQRFLLLITICFVLANGLFAQDTIVKYQKTDFNKKILTKAELAKVNEFDLPLLRGIVFGKRGRVFVESSIQEFLEKQSWYKPNEKFSNSVLSPNEIKNIDLIREAEAEKHTGVEPGDLRFWVKKEIPEDKIFTLSSAEWSILIAEFEAIHGKTFTDEWLQKYFEARYWYKANPSYSPAILSEIERKNLEKFVAKRNEDRKVEISFGDMDKFQNVLLKEEQLKGLNLNELRLLRNEIFARRGRKFTVEGFLQYFEGRDWYRPIKNQAKVKLNETEEANVKLIKDLETRIREKLSTELLTDDALSGLFAEDLRVMRNEIYAKRGRVFKDTRLQKYFIAQPWYVANPAYSDTLLTEIEKNNAFKILKEEETAVSKFSVIEG